MSRVKGTLEVPTELAEAIISEWLKRQLGAPYLQVERVRQPYSYGAYEVSYTLGVDTDEVADNDTQPDPIRVSASGAVEYSGGGEG